MSVSTYRSGMKNCSITSVSLFPCQVIFVKKI